jgi:hypothetical protein
VISRGGLPVPLDDGVAELHADAWPGGKRQLPVTDDRFGADQAGPQRLAEQLG